MRVNESLLADLSQMSEQDQRSWLLANQPTSLVDLAPWWESVVTGAQRLMYESRAEPEKSSLARIAKMAIAQLRLRGLSSATESAIRTASLVQAYYATGGELDDIFDVDSILADCLDSIEVSFSDALISARDWQALRIEEIRRLRQAKNLLRPCYAVSDRVTDAVLSGRLNEWLPVYDLLP